MTETEWQRLYENYETTWLLGAVDHVDALRHHLSDSDPFGPPQIRTDLLRLHGLAMDVVNKGWGSQVGEMAELTVELETEVFEMMESLAAIQQALSKLIELLPEDAFEGES